jgi:hypothetical protein
MEFTKRKQTKFTKRNFTFDETKRNETKRNETKRNEISLFLLFRETSEISRNNFFVSLCFVFRETKKGCKMECEMETLAVPSYEPKPHQALRLLLQLQ